MDRSAPVMDPIGKTLKRLRVEAGKTQDEMAAAVGITQGAISKIEKAVRMPSRQVIEDWLRVCGKTWDIAGIPELSEGERALLDAASELNPDDLWIVAEAVRGFAVVTGKDRTMARQTLEWLGTHAPSPTEQKPAPARRENNED